MRRSVTAVFMRSATDGVGARIRERAKIGHAAANRRAGTTRRPFVRARRDRSGGRFRSCFAVPLLADIALGSVDWLRAPIRLPASAGFMRRRHIVGFLGVLSCASACSSSSSSRALETGSEASAAATYYCGNVTARGGNADAVLTIGTTTYTLAFSGTMPNAAAAEKAMRADLPAFGCASGAVGVAPDFSLVLGVDDFRFEDLESGLDRSPLEDVECTDPQGELTFDLYSTQNPGRYMGRLRGGVAPVDLVCDAGWAEPPLSVPPPTPAPVSSCHKNFSDSMQVRIWKRATDGLLQAEVKYFDGHDFGPVMPCQKRPWCVGW
jgi:hypothetical protein